MPTGYIAEVQDGTVTDFRTFALRCARAFGASVMQRDDPASDPPKHREESPHYAKSITEARNRLSWLCDLTPPKAQREAEIANAKALREYDDGKVRQETERARYEAMLTEVRAWTPPTSDHRGLQTFMIEQLESSINFDCGYEPDPPKRLSGGTWLAAEREKAAKDITYYKKALQEERERVSKANAWIDALYASLPNTMVAA